jgi:4-hydroxy-tetrahydrodipicolinate synthase
MHIFCINIPFLGKYKAISGFRWGQSLRKEGSMRLRGTFTAIISPFLGDRAQEDARDCSLDEEGFRQLVKRQLVAGISGIVIYGSTGECPTLEPEELERLIGISREEMRAFDGGSSVPDAGSVPLIVGTGTYSTKRTIQATRRAKDLGADYALVVVPYYNKPSDEGLYRHFRAVAEEGGLPLIVYNIAGRTARNLPSDVLERLAALRGIVGVKEGSGDLGQMTEVIERIGRERADFSVLSGDDALAFPLIALGGDGLVSTASNIVPERMLALVEAALEGDLETARMRHFGLLPLFRALVLETNPGPIKEAMALAGLPSGPLRPPLAAMSDVNKEALRGAMLAAGLGSVVQESAA